MPTRIKFNSGETFAVAEDFDQANQQLGAQAAGLFTMIAGEDRVRVTVFASAVSYLVETSEAEVTGGYVY
jgi:hypothetical protein